MEVQESAINDEWIQKVLAGDAGLKRHSEGKFVEELDAARVRGDCEGYPGAVGVTLDETNSIELEGRAGQWHCISKLWQQKQGHVH